jgi:hypothetical protein
MRLTTLIFAITLLTVLIPTTDMFAQSNDRTDVRASETDAVAVDSVVDELAGIVVLCATQPQSVEFKNAWTTWVRQHHQPGMDIDAVINDVLTRARAYNATQRSRTITQKKSRVTTTEKMMHDTAMAVIRKIGG